MMLANQMGFGRQECDCETMRNVGFVRRSFDVVMLGGGPGRGGGR